MYKNYLRLLEKTGETTYQVSEATGIKNNIFSCWKKRSEKNPKATLSMIHMKQLSDHFNVSLDFFYE